MKRIIAVILGLLIMLPINTKALTGSISIECDKQTYKVNETAKCKIRGTSGEEVYSISAQLDLESVLFDIKVSTSGSWQGDGEEGDIQLYTDQGKKGTFDIGEIQVKLKSGKTLEKVESSDIDLELTNITYSDTNGKEYTISNESKKITFSNEENNSSGSSNGQTSSGSTTTKTTSTSTSTNPSTGIFEITGIVIAVLGLGIYTFRKTKYEN